MAAEKPVVYILHGDDKVAMERFIDSILARMGDPSIAELNTARLDGRQASEEDLRTAALAMPFLADRRLVILSNPLSRLGNPAAQERFTKLLDSIPATTALVLVIDDHRTWKGWEVLGKTGLWLAKWSGGAGKRALVKECALPDVKAMPAWIEKHAQESGGKLTREAALALSEHTGNDTALAEQEIAKLFTYVDGQRAVEIEDVELLVITGGPINVFHMVEALADRNSRQALRMLHALQADTDPSHLFGLIVRQFRFLIQVREVLDEGGDLRQVLREVKGIKFANQFVAQASRFTQPELDAIHHRLLELDEQMKTSQVPSDLALELLVAEIAH